MIDGQEHIAALKDAADPVRIAAVLGLHGKGKRFFCPVCQRDGGKTPDLSVQDKGFICFKCGLKGDLLKLVMVAGNKDFKGAVAVLEASTGIPALIRHKGGHNIRGGARKAVYTSFHKAITPSLTLKKPDLAIYAAFLDACRPVEGRALDWLTKDKGISPAVISALGIRFCGKEYPDIMAGLKERFGDASMLSAGLLKPSKTGRPVLLAWYYYTRKAGFLVIPYMKEGRPVYLKLRPPLSKEAAERLKLVRFMNTAAAVPCLYNLDGLKGAEKVLICEGESDTWTALTPSAWSSPDKLKTWTAVGSPGSRQFKPDWVALFKGFRDASGRSRVYLVMDADKAGKDGCRIVSNLFIDAGLPIPLKLNITSGKDLSEYHIKGGIIE